MIPPDDGDLADYLASLRRVLEFDVERIYPAHGPVLEPARPVIEGYIAHRLERDAQILAAVGRRRRDRGRHRRPRLSRGLPGAPPGRAPVRALAPQRSSSGRVGSSASAGDPPRFRLA